MQTFADSDGDGIGDFAGLTSKVDYLAGLGVTCIWLMPFYPTADKDDGYDITEHYAIDPRLGSFGDFTEFIRTARDRGMRVIADLVVNHTSDQHPWFQAARRSRESRFREFYVWRDEIPSDGPTRRRLPRSSRTGVWTYDPEAGQYYLHRFYRHQPDLNVASFAVREEIRKLIGFWLAQGLSGFRVDAVPFLLETDGTLDEMELDPHEYLRDLRAFLSRRAGEAVLLGEVNLPAERAAALLRRRGRRRAAHALRLPRHASDLAGAGPLGRPAADRCDPPATADPARDRVGVVPAQPRRAHPRQADRTAAERGVRRVRTRTSTCSSTGAGCADASRACSAVTSGGSAWPTA